LSDVSCTETPTKEKVIVIVMSTGGNCAQCEWPQCYSWDGKVVGASRHGKQDPATMAALQGTSGKKATSLGQGDFSTPKHRHSSLGARNAST
jgi:hypothetical protein